MLRGARGWTITNNGNASKHSDNDGDSSPSNGREKLVEGAATAFGSIAILALAGYAYNAYYKRLMLSKMENAFAPGYSSLELAHLGRQSVSSPENTGPLRADFAQDAWIARPEQELVNSLVDGTIQGQYYLITGERGTGKTSMLLHAMERVEGDGIAMLEAHMDQEVFRLRLGKALDYEFHEDYMGSLFSFRGPRDTTPLLDIERAFNKMEKVAMTRRERTGKPLVLIIKSAHLLRNDTEGQALLELLQQRAKLWAASCLVTTVLVSNDYWITERLTAEASRMRVVSVRDVPKAAAIAALKSFRAQSFGENVDDSFLHAVYAAIGGRLRFLAQVAISKHMEEAYEAICAREKRWLLNKAWIMGGEMDDAVEEQQDYCAAAMLLAKALVEKERIMDKEDLAKGKLPQISLHLARQIMTRPDFIELHDHDSIFTIDSESMVQADSVAMQRAFRDICQEEGFEEHLQATLTRLDEIESLGRTRELTLKDLRGDGQYLATLDRSKANAITLTSAPSK